MPELPDFLTADELELLAAKLRPENLQFLAHHEMDRDDWTHVFMQLERRGFATVPLEDGAMERIGDPQIENL